MAAKIKRKMVMSMRKEKLQREPAGRRSVGGIGVVDGGAAGVRDKGKSNLGEGQLARGRIIVKELGVAAPLDGGFQLTAGFVFAEMLVQQVAEKFVGKRAIGFGF